MRQLTLVMLAGGFAAIGCGPSYSNAFSHHFLDNQEADLAAILARLPEASPDAAPENSLGVPIAVAATHTADGTGRQIVAWRIDSGERLWATAVDAATQPEILGDVVLTSTRDRLLAFDLGNGRELWHHDLPDLAYVGAARDGATIYWAATVGALGGARRVGHVVAVDARGGGERWRHEVLGVFGQPAAVGGLVFVPWERQNIAILDEMTGDELARLRSTDDVLAWAFNHPTGLYYGGRGIYRLTPRSQAGVRAQSTYTRPTLGELPRQPESIWPDGFVPKPGTRSARGRIRVYFNPAVAPDAESIRFEGDTYYFVYYRYVFAYDIEGTLRWSRVVEQDIANAEVMRHGLLTFGEQGRMHLLDSATGNDRWTQDTEMQIASVALDAAGFNPGGEAGDPRPLRESLNEMILDPDNRLVAARAYAVLQLAQIEDAEITRDLLDLYQQRSMPGALKEALREALIARRSGEQYLMEALARRYDYLEETQAPPLEAIVPALLAMNHADAVPQLVNHMMDHETPAEVLPQLVDAIVRLGGEDAIPALERFLTLYGEDSLFAGPVTDQQPEEEGGQVIAADPEARAIAIAAAGIFEHGGVEGRQHLDALTAEASRLHEPVQDHIRGLRQAETDAATASAAAEELARAAALAEAAREAEAALPARLTQAQVSATFIENADPLRECVADELERNPRLMQVRLVFILSNDGRAGDIGVSPQGDDLSACMQQRVAAIQFPRFRNRRMRAHFTISIGGSGGEDSEDAGGTVRRVAAGAAPPGAPWYWYAQRTAQLTLGEEGASAIPAGALAWWSERAAPVTQTHMPQEPEIEECAPGPAGQACRIRQRQGGTAQEGGQHASTQEGGTQEGGTQEGGTQEGGTAEEGGTQEGGTVEEGTPWWAAAGGDDDDEEDED